MIFKTYKEFIEVHNEIKELYKTMNLKDRRELKQYIYSMKMPEYKQNRIWEYLNDDKSEELLLVFK